MKRSCIAMKLAAGLVLACMTGAAGAAEATLPALDALPQPTLPPAALVAQARSDVAAVRQADATLQAAQAERRALVAGSEEFELQLQGQRRRVGDGADAGRYNEWQVQLSRPLRWPQQARADAEVGAGGVALAAAGVSAASRSSAERLLQLWFDAGRTDALAALARRAADVLLQQQQALARRVELGDASRLELDQLGAEAAREQAQATLAAGRADAARRVLLARYPAAELSAGEPLVTSGAPDALAADALARSAALALARAARQQAAALAAQADAMRRPQPTLGVYTASERGGAERLAGVQLSLPLGGAARAARADARAADAMAAQWRARDVEQAARAELQSRAAQADALARGARQLEQVDAAQRQADARLQRAYALGEASLTDALVQRRELLRTLADALAARYDAAQADAMLQLDAGVLWSSPTR
jgi:outer membrane protein TolC